MRCSESSLAETCLLAERQASYRWQELCSGSITELGNLDNDELKGKVQWAHPRGRIPMHCFRGGSARSSDETSVMGGGAKGLTNFTLKFANPAAAGDELIFVREIRRARQLPGRLSRTVL